VTARASASIDAMRMREADQKWNANTSTSPRRCQSGESSPAAN